MVYVEIKKAYLGWQRSGRGANLRDLTAFATHRFTDEKALYTGSTWEQLVAG